MRTIFLTVSILALTACTSSTDDSKPEPASAVPPGATPETPAAPPPVGTTTPTPTPGPTPDIGAIYTLSNDASGNEIVAFQRDAEGALANGVRFATGGLGAAKGLGSQSALALSSDGRFLVAVNAGSDDISSFEIVKGSLELRSRIPSAGAMPISVAIHDSLVYALDAVGNDISGYRLGADGALTAIAGSTRQLSAAAAGGAQVAFAPKGDALIVTEKATDTIDTYVIDASGMPSAGEAHPAAGKTPFGFSITPQGFILVTEAFGAAAGASAVSSYSLETSTHAGIAASPERGLTTISPSVVDHQTAACWLAVTSDGQFAYTANTPNGNISGYKVGADGALTLLGGVWGVTGDGSKPADMAMDRASKHLYVLAGGSHDIRRFDVGAGGALVGSTAVVAVPPNAVGLVGN